MPQLHYRNICTHLWRQFLVFDFGFLVLDWKSFVICTSVLDVVF